MGIYLVKALYVYVIEIIWLFLLNIFEMDGLALSKFKSMIG